MEQKYFDCTYRFDSKYYQNRVHLFDSRYKEMLDGVFVDGKFYSHKDKIRTSKGVHSVRLVFKEGLEPECLTNFFRDTCIISVNDTNIDFSKVTDMSRLFYRCESLANLDALQNWDVSNVRDMSEMFSRCVSLANIDALQDWDVSNVRDMSEMFFLCDSLTNLDALKDWDVSNVEDMAYMFCGCKPFTNLDALKDWDVSNVDNMVYMFRDCESLANLDALQNWDVSNVENMLDMFRACKSLTNLDALQNWYVFNAENCKGMFAECTNLGAKAFSSDTMNRLTSRRRNLIDFLIKADALPDRVVKSYKKLMRRIEVREFYNELNEAEKQVKGKGLKK